MILPTKIGGTTVDSSLILHEDPENLDAGVCIRVSDICKLSKQLFDEPNVICFHLTSGDSEAITYKDLETREVVYTLVVHAMRERVSTTNRRITCVTS